MGRKDDILNPNVVIKYGMADENILSLAKETFLEENDIIYQERAVRSAEDYEREYRDLLRLRSFEIFLDNACRKMPDEELKINAKCEVCQKNVDMIVDMNYSSDGYKVNWPERVVCPICGCNSRQRFVAGHLLRQCAGEQRRLLFTEDERIRETAHLLYGENIIIKDYTAFSSLDYQPESIDLIVLDKVLEYVKDYRALLKELYGIMRYTAHAFVISQFDCKSEVITELDGNQGKEHIFGWNLANEFKSSGFFDFYGKVYYGVNVGYFDYLSLYFCAEK